MEELTPVQAADSFRLDSCQMDALADVRRVVLASADEILESLHSQVAALPGANLLLGDAAKSSRFRTGVRRWLKESLRSTEPDAGQAMKDRGVAHARMGVPVSHIAAAFGLLKGLCLDAILKEVAAGRLKGETALSGVKALTRRLMMEQVGMLSAHWRHAKSQLELQQSALEEVVQNRAERLRSTVSLSQVIADEIDETQVVRILAQHVMNSFTPDCLAVCIVQSGEIVESPVVICEGKRCGADAMASLRGNWQFCRAARTGRTFHVADVRGSLVKCRYQVFKQEEGSYCCIPLAGGTRVCGWMHVAREQPNGFSDDDLEVLGIYGQMAGAAITSLRLVAENRHQATTDSLTGLNNRRHFQGVLDKEEQLQKRRKEAVSVLMIDVDRFKDFNDRFGHETGDRILRALADKLRQCVRRGDEIARMGGDEFVVLLRNCATHDAARIAEKIVHEAATISVPTDDSQPVRIGLCVGVACCPQHAPEMPAAMHLADAALRRAKQAGRNRYVVHGVKHANGTRKARERSEDKGAPVAASAEEVG